MRETTTTNLTHGTHNTIISATCTPLGTPYMMHTSQIYNASHIYNALQTKSCLSSHPSSSTSEIILSNRSPNTLKNETYTSRGVQPSRREVTSQSNMDSSVMGEAESTSALEVETSNFQI